MCGVFFDIYKQITYVITFGGYHDSDGTANEKVQYTLFYYICNKHSLSRDSVNVEERIYVDEKSIHTQGNKREEKGSKGEEKLV